MARARQRIAKVRLEDAELFSHAQNVASYTALRALTGDASGVTGPQTVVCRGRASNRDGGEGVFVWEGAGGDDDGSKVGGWRRVFDGDADVRWWGAVGNDSTDCSDAFLAAMSSSVERVIVPAGVYRINQAAQTWPSGPVLKMRKGAVLAGSGGVTINALIEAGPYKVFELNGGLTVTLGNAQEVLTEWFGALGNDSADDTVALERAMACAWNSRSGAIRFLPRSYVFNLRKIAMPVSGVTRVLSFRGAFCTERGDQSARGTRLHFARTDGTHFLEADLSPRTGSNPTYEFYNLDLVGPDTDGVTNSSGDGIRIMAGTYSGTETVAIVRMQNVRVSHFRGGTGLRLKDCQNSSYINVRAYQCKKGWHIDEASNSSAWFGCGAFQCREHGVFVEDTNDGTWSGGDIQSNDEIGIELRHCIGWNVTGVHYENNNRTNVSGKSAIKLSATTTPKVCINNTFQGGFCALDHDGVTIEATGFGVVNNNKFVSMYNTGVNLGGVTGRFATINSVDCQGNRFIDSCQRQQIDDGGFATAVDFNGCVETSAIYFTAFAASAIALNPTYGKFYKVDGTPTDIDHLSTTGRAISSEIVLQFVNALGCKVKHATGSAPAGHARILLNGSADRTFPQYGTLKLMWDGAQWVEIPRYS